VLGGWLVDTLSWRAIFYINVPIAVITLIIVFEHVPESRDRSEDSTVDWRGGFLVTVGLLALAYGLTAISERNWTHISVSGSLLVSAVFMAAFIWSEAHGPSPMLPLGLDLQRCQRYDATALFRVERRLLLPAL
jgi:MFS family permease